MCEMSRSWVEFENLFLNHGINIYRIDRIKIDFEWLKTFAKLLGRIIYIYMFQKSQLTAASFGPDLHRGFFNINTTTNKKPKHVDDVCWFLSVVETLRLPTQTYLKSFSLGVAWVIN